MKSLKTLIPLIFVLAMLFPMALLAQEATPEAGTTLTMLQALELVRAAYGADVVILEVDYDDATDGEAAMACWDFALADGTELCVDALTGEIVLNTPEAEMTPDAEETEDAEDVNDGEADNNDDGEADNNDD